MQNADSQHAATPAPGAAPAIYLEPSVSTTTVVTTTTTVTTYAPIPLPALPLPPPEPTDPKEYPLYNVQLPQSMREFGLVFPGGKRAVFREERSESAEAETVGEEGASGKGWRMMPKDESWSGSNSSSSVPVVGLTEALEGFNTNTTRKRERGSNGSSMDSGDVDTPPARKKARAPPSPLPSPRGSPPPTSTRASPTSEMQLITPSATPFQPDLALTTLLALPSLVTHYTSLPPSLQSHLLLTLLRHSPLPVLRTLHSVLHPSLARDFLTLLPPELGSHILGYLADTSLKALGRACRVCKGWRGRIECDKVLWRDLLVRRGLWFGGESEGNFVKMLLRKRRHAIQSESDSLPLPHPYKILFKSRYLTLTRWITNPTPKHISFPAHGHSVVTCLLFSQNRIISASDDHSIHIYDPTSGRLIQKLDGHEGGVWALAVHGNLLVSGSTDRTVRIWDLDDPQGRCLHVFGGHTSTVRCLAIVKPELWGREKEKWPKRTLVVTGSRDHTLRVWRLPKRNERPFDSRLSHQHAHTPPSPHPSPPSPNPPPDDPALNPYHIHLLSGHTHAVRALAARGRVLVSGSYDCMVRVWDVVEGRCVWRLEGHSQKVYSVVLDSSGDGTSSDSGSGSGYGLGWGLGAGASGSGASRCASGSMDGTVRLWSISTGQCLAVLSGHTSLVGLLGLSPSFLVSAAADSTLRVWDARNTPHASSSNSSTRNPTSLTPGTGAAGAGAGGVSTSNDLLRGIMSGHTGAITCFQHDEWKVVSGSDGTLKVWDLRDVNASASFPGGPGLGAANANAAFGGGGGGLGPGAANANAGLGVGGANPTPLPIPVTRDLLTGITGVWQVAFEGRWCVSASNRNDVTVLDVWDFSSREGDVEGGGEGVEGGLGGADPLSAFVEEVSPPEEEEVPHTCTSTSAWTWQDEEWLGEPPGGVYDYEDSELEFEGDDIDIDLEHESEFGLEGNENEVIEIDEDEDGDIELISVHGEGEGEEDEDIVYTGRRVGSGGGKRKQREMRSVSRVSVPPSSVSTSSAASRTSAGTSKTTRKTRRSRPIANANSSSRPSTSASAASTRSRSSRAGSVNSRMEIDTDGDIDALPQVPEAEEEYSESQWGVRGGFGSDGDAEMEMEMVQVESMMDVDVDGDGEPLSHSHSHSRRQRTRTNPNMHTRASGAGKRPQQQQDVVEEEDLVEEDYEPTSPSPCDPPESPSHPSPSHRTTGGGMSRRAYTAPGAQNNASSMGTRRTASSTASTRAVSGHGHGRRGHAHEGPSTSTSQTLNQSRATPTEVELASGGDTSYTTQGLADDAGAGAGRHSHSRRRWL